MLTLAIHYLNGWAMAAADGARKEQAEWPPHPDRVFMALAAAWFETGEEPAEGEALRWLENQEPPAIAASGYNTRRSLGGDRPPVGYVPVNDSRVARKAPVSTELDKLKEAGLAVLPEFRPRQPRAFPVAIPDDPVVRLIWSADPGSHRAALEQLVGKVTHVGHSASFTQLWFEDTPAVPVWQPTAGVGELRLRVPESGRLERLARRCNRNEAIAFADLNAQMEAAKGVEKKRMQQRITERFGGRAPLTLRPDAGRWQGYVRHCEEPAIEQPGSIFDPRLLVLTLAGKRLPLSSTLQLTEALRGTLMAACPVQPPPEWLSGHRPDGGTTTEPHMALLPLPFVGSGYADGRIMGLAIALPRGLEPAEAARCFSPFLHDADGLPRPNRLFDGKWFEVTVTLNLGDTTPVSLRPELWTRPARSWATVTPIALDRHFDGPDKWERAAEGVKDACERIGLPRPCEVLLHPVSLVEGAPPVREFPHLTRKSDGGRRHHSHAIIVFEAPVCGPVIVGAGRFRGYGLCRPMDGGGDGRG